MKTSKKTIYLTGFMGAGKSTVGKLLAQKLGLGFIDLDEYIEEKSGKTIPEIFTDSGEACFRNLESEALREVSVKTAVISTGGGVTEKEENRKLMKRTGTVFFLDAPFYVLYERIRDDKSRPLARGEKEVLRERYENRRPGYEWAALTLDTKGCSPYEVVQKALQHFDE
ncbi:shikimate kinase [Alteribacter keqinensis]|uniref:Shikimate kinase n=1 Tax=Alteribacter keqinensis TaxID=2483800 RepID=A0A3M7TVD1_9BACI|nr:shikimate kinase [Alteribacter keqinensis]RNA68952.1 shikimate kinase [Alteribacter keqinensis]